MKSFTFQIWAANDIRIFVRMMTHRNVELQLQALDLIERRHNSLQKDDDELDEENKIIINKKVDSFEIV